MSRAREGRMDELQQSDNVKANSKFSKKLQRSPTIILLTKRRRFHSGLKITIF